MTTNESGMTLAVSNGSDNVTRINAVGSTSMDTSLGSIA